MKRYFLLFAILTTHNFYPGIIDEIKNYSDIPGWCSEEKAEAILNHIKITKPKLCVEIGVYGGKSLIPMAHGLKKNGSGLVIGIDPWELTECTRNYSSDHPVSQIWEKINLEEIYFSLKQKIELEQLEDFCLLVRSTSIEAATEINSIDFLHIDGNHSELSTLIDVQLYFPKVKTKGYILLDDVLRPSTMKAYSIVRDNSELVHSYDKGNCLLFRKY